MQQPAQREEEKKKNSAIEAIKKHLKIIIIVYLSVVLVILILAIIFLAVTQPKKYVDDAGRIRYVLDNPEEDIVIFIEPETNKCVRYPVYDHTADNHKETDEQTFIYVLNNNYLVLYDETDSKLRYAYSVDGYNLGVIADYEYKKS